MPVAFQPPMVALSLAGARCCAWLLPHPYCWHHLWLGFTPLSGSCWPCAMRKVPHPLLASISSSVKVVPTSLGNQLHVNTEFRSVTDKEQAKPQSILAFHCWEGKDILISLITPLYMKNVHWIYHQNDSLLWYFSMK